MLLHVHVDGTLQCQLTVLNHDRVFVLRDPVHRSVEGPVEDDARRFAAKAWIVFALEGGRFLLAECGELGAVVETRSGRRCPATGSRAASTATCPGASRARRRRRAALTDLAEWYEAAAGAARIRHHDLLRRPIARDI